MSDVALGRFNRWIEKFFNAKGGPTTIDVGAAIQPVLVTDKGIDHRYLEGWNRFAIVANQPAVAAQFSRVRIRNPVGSNVITVIETLFAFEAASDQVLVSYGNTVTDLATLVGLTFSRLDPRGNPQPTSIVSINAQAGGGTAFLQRPVTATAGADFIFYPDQQIPVLPGNVLDLQAQVVNQPLVVNFMWRERALESSELT